MSGNTTQSSAPLNFIFVQNPNVPPTTAVNLNAAHTNTFYVVNTIHDMTYRCIVLLLESRRNSVNGCTRYGFTEAAFNFQTNNFGKGGLGNDRVIIFVQDSAGIDNTDFSTPAE